MWILLGTLPVRFPFAVIQSSINSLIEHWTSHPISKDAITLVINEDLNWDSP